MQEDIRAAFGELVTDLTTQKHHEVMAATLVKLRESEDRFRRLVALLPAAVYTCEAPSGAITFFNEHAALLWGRAPEIGGRAERYCGSPKLWWPDGRPLPRDETPMAVAVREGQKIRNQELVIERLDGSRITVLVNIDPVRDQSGRVVGTINTFHDISALKHAQAALVAKERQLQHVSDNAAVMVAQCTRDLRYTFVNQTYARFLDRPIEQIVGWTIADVMGSTAFEAIRPHIDRVLAGDRVEFEAEIPYDATSPRYMRAVYVPDTNSHGVICGWIAAITDITDRKRAEEALRASEARLSAFLEQLPVGVGATDLDGRWTISNAVMRAFEPERVPSPDPHRAGRWRAFDAQGKPLAPED
jgi:PAS domain S-box-containing protein